LRGSLEYGKSTITNKILNKQVADTGDISKKNKRGKNTTTDSTLYMIEENNYFLDTPGFQTIDIFEIETKDLDKYSSVIKDAIIKDDNVNLLSIYTSKSNIVVNKFSRDVIINEVNKYYKFIESNNLRPKYYSIVLINKEDITKSLEIENLTSELIINNIEEIVDSIINKDKKVIDKYNINYKYID